MYAKTALMMTTMMVPDTNEASTDRGTFTIR